MAPWERNAGRFDTPSSAAPVKGAPLPASIARKPASPLEVAASRRRFLDQRCADARRQGVIAVNADTLLQRIDLAIEACIAAGKGNPRSICLTDPDLLALHDVTGAGYEYRDLPVNVGTASMVFARGGRQAIRKRLPKGAE